MTHAYSGAGDYEVTVTATDDSSAVGTASEPVTVGGGAVVGDLQVPVDRKSNAVFKLGSTLPVKVRVTDCDGAVMTGLTPRVTIERADGKQVRVVGASAADDGDALRLVDGQYLHTTSLKQSRFTDGSALTAGSYTVRVSDPAFGSVERVVTLAK